MATLEQTGRSDNVIDLFSREHHTEDKDAQQIIRLAPELDGLEMLYCNDHHPGRLFSMKILFWALTKGGDVIALVPWLNQVVDCTELTDPLNGHWEGFFDASQELIFFEPPPPKRLELESAENYFHSAEQQSIADPDTPTVLQELPDNIGTHAVLTENNFHSFKLAEILSWRLLSNGQLQGMLVNPEKIDTTPVLPGDACLYPAQDAPGFRYFFHHRIANKIKAKDPDAIAAVAMLVDS